MNGVDTVFAIYGHGVFGVAPAAASSFYILHLFDENGVIDRDLLHKIGREILLVKDERLEGEFIGPFGEKAELENFVRKVAEVLRAELSCLLSVTDYNAAMEGVVHISKVRDALLAKGISSINESKKKGKGILGKLFDF